MSTNTNNFIIHRAMAEFDGTILFVKDHKQYIEIHAALIDIGFRGQKQVQVVAVPQRKDLVADLKKKLGTISFVEIVLLHEKLEETIDVFHRYLQSDYKVHCLFRRSFSVESPYYGHCILAKYPYSINTMGFFSPAMACLALPMLAEYKVSGIPGKTSLGHWLGFPHQGLGVMINAHDSPLGFKPDKALNILTDFAVKDGLFSVIVLLMGSDVMIQEPGAFADISDIVNGMP